MVLQEEDRLSCLLCLRFSVGGGSFERSSTASPAPVLTDDSCAGEFVRQELAVAVVAAGERQSDGCPVWLISSDPLRPDENVSWCPTAGWLGLKIHCRKYTATKENGSRPLHSHTGSPDRLNTENTCREAVFTTMWSLCCCDLLG